MARLRMQVVGNEVRLESDRGWREVQPDRLLLSAPDPKGNRFVLGMGTVWPTDDAFPDDAEERRVFDPDTFNPDLAAEWVRFWDGKARKAAGIRGWLSRGRLIELRWTDWPRLARPDREQLLRSLKRYVVIVNGVQASGSPDLTRRPG